MNWKGREFKITFDRIKDPEEITYYEIGNKEDIIIAKGRYITFLGFRIGFHYVKMDQS